MSFNEESGSRLRRTEIHRTGCTLVARGHGFRRPVRNPEAPGNWRPNWQSDQAEAQQMKSIVVYHSTYGNTERIAWAIGDMLSNICECEARCIGDHPVIGADTDLLVIGGPTKSHGIDWDMRHFLDLLDPAIVQGQRFAAFDTRIAVPSLISGSAAKGIAKRLMQLGGHMVASPESFFVEGNDGPLRDGEIERAGGWAREVAASTMTHA
jgi:flavodoxin